MAVDTVAGVTAGGIKLACILAEGAPTVTKKTMGTDGYFETGIVWASQIEKGAWVVLDIQEQNTYALTGGLPVVKAATSGSLIVGRVVSEPRLVNAPATSAAADTHAERLAGKYYRVATVEWFGLNGVAKAVVVSGDADAIVPGVAGTIQIDASATAALANADSQGPVLLSCSNVASGAAGIVSFHYIPNDAGTVSAMIAITGGVVTIVA